MPDYIVIGSGIVGLSTAYHISEQDKDSSILIIDKYDGPGAGDTSKSAAAFRTAFTSKLNILLSSSSIEFYSHLQKNEKFDLGMRHVGYLFSLDKNNYSVFKKGLEYAEKLGVEFSEIENDYLQNNLGIKTDIEGSEEADIIGAHNIYKSILFKNAGILDPEKIIDYYYGKLKDRNVEFSYGIGIKEFIIEPEKPLGIEGEPFAWEEIKVKGVRLNDGTIVRANKKIISALGAWSNLYLNKIGLDSYSRPKKRQIFSIKADNNELKRILYSKGFNDENTMPFVILPKGVYIRPNPSENTFWIGLSDELGRKIELEDNPVAEENFYLYSILPVLSLYFDQFKEKNPYASWAGHYDISFDGQPIIYEPYESNLIISAGTSGSGIMKGDSIGRITASLALNKEYANLFDNTEFNVSWLGLEGRLVEKELLII
ncbi:glycine/D-amino acid oxidase, deaminating [Caldisphaera lagunensis DSM 15908]|uniref:Glycine/D-amino acid oxidase, deaminating n=1 Tax=Caldisphaera lagunensis (strain DSM 15908 / JCM 11604 / ANMR 0165 / IC-154) TaxID=1056495 RepID=L0AAD2_CALLD|nr:FAD-binding oxidoreductase [Caldisphaera lagunensis]AFZ70868.1 glycine/D-amino acid oxidase, deaminating [Caldisphaera lagunensis DSM 15908]